MNVKSFFTGLAIGLGGMLYVLIAKHTQPYSSYREQPSTEKLIEQQLGTNAVYAPWRDHYQNTTTRQEKPIDECAFCSALAENDDAKQLILRRFNHFAVMLNLYPYAKGHVLIVPFEHKKTLSDFSAAARQELIELIDPVINALKTVIKIEGVNIGFNYERVAGASIPDHLHIHILPRNLGDSSFIQLIGKTQVVSIDFPKLYKELKPAFDAIKLAHQE